MKNAIILAAGVSKKFAPFTYEKPKGLFCVKKEVLIERQIMQLKEAGISQIVVIVGFMKEKFFYLEEKFGVTLIINNDFSEKGNLFSLYCAKDYLGETFLCCGDHYFPENPFLEESDVSYRACVEKEKKFNEFAGVVSDCGVISQFTVGGENQLAMVGHAYFKESFSKKFVLLMEEKIHDFGVSQMFWEVFWGKYLEHLTLFAKMYKEESILEFESVEELIQFDQEFLNNVDSSIVKNIVSILHCDPVNIIDIEVIQKGLTNVSFKFSADGKEYVYRHPGGTSSHLVNRQTEVFAQLKAKEIGIDPSVIHIDVSGWKLSYFVQNIVPCTLGTPEELQKGMNYIKKMHQQTWTDEVKMFDTYEESIKLMSIASATKGNLLEEFSEFVEKFKRLDGYLKNDGLRELALCHNDTYPPNYILTKEEELYLIDWEYAGVNDKAHDIGCICCRYDMTDEEIEGYFLAYFGRPLTTEEHRHYIASVALAAFYWFSWGLYKGSVNDDDGFYFLTTYRNCRRFLDPCLALYGEKD